MKLLARIRALWYLSGISKEDLQENPQLFSQFVNKRDSPKQAYITGLSEEESNFNESLNYDNKPTIVA